MLVTAPGSVEPTVRDVTVAPTVSSPDTGTSIDGRSIPPVGAQSRRRITVACSGQSVANSVVARIDGGVASRPQRS